MKYQVLGPIKLVDGDTAQVIQAQKMGTALAVLVVHANQVVSTKQLIGEIWDEDPPLRAVPALHVYISQLRKLLSRPGDEDSPIVTQAPGYLLKVDPEDIDYLVFQELVRTGRGHLMRGRGEEALAAFEQALGLWCGPMLSGLPIGPMGRGLVTRIEEIRVECLERLVETKLMLGRHRELVSSLYGLINEHPLNEVFYEQLMRALYSSGRRADALRVYRTAWETLDRELGLEPGARLREAQRTILARDADRVRVAG
ncbi:DNA-binding SARP family transcriptional activator [Actinocorallia herbida]|uniref:DNA-binding SARP family transcriptional activator n=1 Tax=Actinocorallia herbida TaxID=58109 RepID=A0A3N1D0I0_9ACTN|nr:AfsR/SARP family transcriptional regulator [Actinocorallia herbida]ROO87032.1 DNA-binding SARP family transcriptional activator [Actinocorallia herbida]